MRYRYCKTRDFSKEICEWYKNGKSLIWIMERLCLSHYQVIRKILVENGFDIRKQTSHRDNRHKLDLDFFKNIDSPEKAYWLGYLTADGYILPDGYKVTLVSKDLEIIEKFKKSIQSEHPIGKYSYKDKRTQKIYTQYNIQINSKQFVKNLINLGVVNKKSNNCQFPNIDKKYYGDYIRGLFDGDGSICYVNGALRINLIATCDILLRIQEILYEKFQINKTILQTVKDNIKKWYCQNADDIKLFLDFIYSDSKDEIRLSRKYDKYSQHYHSEISYILWDIDGTLIESSPEIHHAALNKALEEIDIKYRIMSDEFETYNGLPTMSKLDMLSSSKGLPKNLHKSIWKRKQEITSELIAEHVKNDISLIELFKLLNSLGYKMAVCTNCIRPTTDLFIEKLGLKKYIDFSLSNEDVVRAKPSGEIYKKATDIFKANPRECLVIEDTEKGKLSAIDANCNYLLVDGPRDLYNANAFVTCVKNKLFNTKIKNIMNITNYFPKKKFPFKGNILIPMAGDGTRFKNAGFTFPKPLIDTINNKPMIQLVVESLGLDGHYIYLVRQEHLEKYNLKQMLNLITPGCDIVIVDKLTEGACCTTLLAKEFINNDLPLVIANSDQYIEWKPEEFMYLMNNQNIDGGILTFKNTHPKWSYAKVEDGFVTEVAEKNPISTNATVGVYYYKNGSDYVKYANQMIDKNIRVNGELYVAPVWNEFILDNKKIKIYDVDKMCGLGTPEDLHTFIQMHGK